MCGLVGVDACAISSGKLSERCSLVGSGEWTKPIFFLSWFSACKRSAEELFPKNQSDRMAIRLDKYARNNYAVEFGRLTLYPLSMHREPDHFRK